jgi:Flp pilus assembly protein TadD
MDADRARENTELHKRGYSEDEIASLYEFGRLALENGHTKRAEVLFHGLVQVAPDFAPAWLALAYIHILGRNFDDAIFASRQALRISPDFTEAMLFLTSCLLTENDFHAAGTHLGEIGERIDAGYVEDPNVVRYYRVQLARYQNRQSR